jgi:predicted DNA-binding transcriptional regulator AlpA
MVQKLRQAKLPVSEVSQLTGISKRSIHRIQQEPEIENADEAEFRKSRKVGRPSGIDEFEADIAQWLAEPRKPEDGDCTNVCVRDKSLI